MERARWEELCRLNGFKPVAREIKKFGTVLVAESELLPGQLASDLDVERKSHFKMLWALEKGKMETAMMIRLSAIEHPVQRDRIRHAIAGAEGIYGNA